MSGKSGMRNSGGGIAARGGAAARSAAGATRRVKFGDVVREVKDKIDRADNPYEFYVAGDHMDTEDLKIRRRGRFATDDVGPAFTRVFKPGQILYGSRRTYLKKVCVADFEGITANTTFVLETKDDNVLLQRLLPFLMLGDRFTAWSIKHSKGSTNPYVLFGDLADYEFDLPPMDEQKKLAELLWTANDLKESYKKAITATDEMIKAKFNAKFGMRNAELSDGSRKGTESQGKWPAVKFEDLCVTGPQNGFYKKGVENNGTVRVLKMTQLFAYECMEDATDCDMWAVDETDLSKFKLTPNDLVFGRRSLVPAGAGKCRRVGNIKEDIIFESSMIRATIDTSKALPRYIQLWTESVDGENAMAQMRSGTTVFGIRGSELKALKIPLPPLALQREFVAIADKAESAKANLKKSIAAIDQVMKGLINQ